MKDHKKAHPYDDAMSELEKKFNRHIKRIITIIITIFILIIVIQYSNMRNQALGMFQNELLSVGLDMDDVLENLETQIQLMAKFAEKDLETLDKNLEPDNLKSAFVYETSKDAFELSKATSLISFDTAGNLFGIGAIDKTDFERLTELKMALDLFNVQYYSNVENELNVHSFYLSSEGFVSVYPRYSKIEMELFNRFENDQDTFRYLYQTDLWENVEKSGYGAKTGHWKIENDGILNDGRSVTFEIPVYRFNDFKGIVGSEMALDKLATYLSANDLLNGRLFMVDTDGEVVFAWDYKSRLMIEDTTSIKPFYQNLKLYGNEGNWLLANVGDKPFNLIYEANERDLLAMILPKMAMVSYFIVGLILFILINRYILTNRFFKPAIKMYEYMRLVSHQQDTSKIELPAEWEEWFSGVTDALSLMAVSKSIPGAIVQIGYDHGKYTIHFLGDGLESYFNDENVIDHLLGKSIMDMVINRQQWALKSVLNQSYDHFLPVQYEFCLGTPLESEVWFSLIATPRKEENEGFFWDGILLDVSQRKLLERELSTEKQFVEDLLDTTGAIFSVRNKKLNLVRFNKSYLKLSGYSKDEIMMDPDVEKKLFNDDFEKVYTNFERVLEGDYPNTYESHWKTKDGGTRHLHWTNTALTNHLGEVEYVISTGVDITELLEAYMALKRSEAKFRSIYDNLASGIGLVDMNGKYIEVNDKWTKLLGYSEEEAKEISFMDLTHPSERDISWDNFQSAMNRGTGGSYRLEKRYRRKDGEYIWCDIATSVIEDDTNQENRVILGIITDITARKRVEEQLFLMNHTLEDEKNKVEQLAKDQKLLFEIFEVFKDAPGVDGMFQVLTRLLPNVLTYDNIIFAVRESKDSEVYSVKDFKDDLRKKGQESFFYTGEGIIGKVIRDKKLYVSNDLRIDPFYVPHNERSKSMICVPILYRDFIWGIISLDAYNTNAFDEISQEVLGILATHIALHLEEVNSKLDLSIQAERLRVLHEIVKEMVVERDNHRIARKIIKEKLFPYTAIYAYENQTLELLASDSEWRGKTESGDALIREALNSKTIQSEASENGVLHQQAVPIYFRERVYGIFHICKEEAFTESDNEIASIISEQLSLFWELNMLIERTEFEALIDPLTAVWNRRYMINRLEQEDEKLNRYGGVACVALVDLGDFKMINDIYGHATGDDVLHRTAAVIRENIRRSDFVGRYGGDEFIVFFPNTTIDNAEVFMKRIIQRIMAIQVPDMKEKIIADYGIGSCPEDDPKLIGAINIADERMYRNKRERKRSTLLNL